MADVSAPEERVETFKVLRPVNLGTGIRAAGDFVPEYMEPGAITPQALARLIRMGYIERRLVTKAEMDAFLESLPATVEGSETEEGETSPEETPEPVQAPENSQEDEIEPPVVEEEKIEDLGPVEKTPRKKVVRAPRRSNN